MVKRNSFIILIALAMTTAMAAQSSKTTLASHSSKVAPKPLTPKSAMPTSHKSAAPSVPDSSRKTSADLNRIEKEHISAGSSEKSNAGVAKVAPLKPVQTSKSNGSGINATYQKPKPARN